MTRVLVCGGRDFLDAEAVAAALRSLDNERRITLLIEGGATGADSLARDWAKRRGIPVHTFKADWALWGKAAGPVRNAWMLEQGRPDVVLAFPGGRGTADMVGKAERAGVPVIKPGHPR